MDEGKEHSENAGNYFGNGKQGTNENGPSSTIGCWVWGARVAFSCAAARSVATAALCYRCSFRCSCRTGKGKYRPYRASYHQCSSGKASVTNHPEIHPTHERLPQPSLQLTP